MLRVHSTEHHDSAKPTELTPEDRKFVTTSFGEVVMYFIAVGLVVGLGVLLSSGIDHMVAFFS